MRVLYDGYGIYDDGSDFNIEPRTAGWGKEFLLSESHVRILNGFGSVKIGCLCYIDDPNIQLLIADILGKHETITIYLNEEIHSSASGNRIKIIDDLPNVNTSKSKFNTNTSSFISKNLTLINRAAYEFWSSVDPEDKTTYPKSLDVEKWLIQQGIPSNTAQRLPSIIKPDWAKN
jgi:hypothetical protein